MHLLEILILYNYFRTDTTEHISEQDMMSYFNISNVIIIITTHNLQLHHTILQLHHSTGKLVQSLQNV